MKKPKNILLLGFLVLMNANLLFGQINLDIFEKKWKISANVKDLVKNMDSEQKEAYDQMTDAQKKMVEKGLIEDFENTTFKFNSDNTFKVDVQGIESYEGTWRIGDDGKTIIAQTKDGIEEKVFIKKMQSNLIVVATELKGKANEFTMTPTN